MLILAYAVSALLVILLSLKLSNYVDLLDKQTNLSGAFFMHTGVQRNNVSRS